MQATGGPLKPPGCLWECGLNIVRSYHFGGGDVRTQGLYTKLSDF